MPDCDLHYLMATNLEPLPEEATLSTPNEHVLMQLAVKTLASLCKEFVMLPSTSGPMGPVAMLPEPRTLLPREKPLPEEKPLTTWEKFAKEKGIKKRSRSQKVFDEKTGEYRPRYGYRRRTDNTIEFDPIVPAKPGVDDYTGAEDPFTRARREKKERVAKNKAQQAANIKRARAIKK
ncbi:Hypothetical protein GLP15_3512 [Giardia lamblia P15]|uniref:Ribosome biogenesis regulatory protein n=1 Tax=Giardia intestinalis (strain P15) TaxID=658858 RepID=E1EVP5_GIAIA|nr:Hypothetical protein GLP15_3512 [Giardia lamblia P15]